MLATLLLTILPSLQTMDELAIHALTAPHTVYHKIDGWTVKQIPHNPRNCADFLIGAVVCIDDMGMSCTVVMKNVNTGLEIPHGVLCSEEYVLIEYQYIYVVNCGQ